MPVAAVAAGTSEVTGNTIDTAIPIEPDATETTTTTKPKQINGRFTDLEAIFYPGGKLNIQHSFLLSYLKNITKIYIILSYMSAKCKNTFVARPNDFILKKLRILDKINLEFHPSTAMLLTTAQHQASWEKKTNQYKEEMKQLIILQSLFDLDQQ